MQSAREVLGPLKKKNKEWLSPDTWRSIKEKRDIRSELLGAKSTRLKAQWESAYREKDKEVKRSAEKDKKVYLEELAKEAESAAAKGNLSDVYKITKKLCGNLSTRAAPVKDKDRKRLTSDEEQTARCPEHFQTVLNLPEPA